MDRHEVHAEFAAGTDRPFDSTRDVMKLKVEEHLLTEVLNSLDDIRTFSREELKSDLIKADPFTDRLNLLNGLCLGLHI